MKNLQDVIDKRQKDLHGAADILAKKARRENIFAGSVKVALIVLGAFAATKGTADQIFGVSNTASLVTYTIIGLLVAALAGLEAAFKFESRAAELRLLATTCQSTLREVYSQTLKEIDVIYIPEKHEALCKLLDSQNAKLNDVQEKAARNGVNIALEMIELYKEEMATTTAKFSRRKFFTKDKASPESKPVETASLEEKLPVVNSQPGENPPQIEFPQTDGKLTIPNLEISSRSSERVF